MGKHSAKGTNAVTVAALLTREAKNGRPLRLNWPAQCLDPQGGVRHWADDTWPTAELPCMTEALLVALDVGHEQAEEIAAQPLPKRIPTTPPPPDEAWQKPEAEMLGRLLEALKRLS